MTADHDHTHGSIRAGERYRGRLAAAFVLLAVFMVVEVVAGLATNSLALLSDAGHMLTDVIGLGMSLAAIQLASRGTDRRHQHLRALPARDPRRTGQRRPAHRRRHLHPRRRRSGSFGDPPDVLAGPMLVVAILGLLANLVAFALLRSGAKESLNVEGAYLEVLADTVGSVAVIVAAIVIEVTDWGWVDPAVGIAIALWILPRTWRLGARAVRILVQAAPSGTDLDAIEDGLAAIAGVVDVHDLHVWTLTSDMDVASAHVMVRSGTDTHAVLDQARSLLRDRHHIDHATLQIEPDTHTGCDEVAW